MNDFDGSHRADRAFADLVARAEADPSVLGLFLHGSHAFEGMATGHSDYDLGVITDDSEQGKRWQGEKSKELDWGTTALTAYRLRALGGLHWPDGAERWPDPERYIFAHTRVLIDRLDGQLNAIVREAATFPAHSRDRLPTMLDAYINCLYRSLKSSRDGHPLEAHLDAVESIDYALWVIFALHERHRPPNKYLRWELDRHPLAAPWDQAHLLGRVQRIIADGDPETQRTLFRGIESTARTNGLGEVVDDWGIDLKLLHGDR
jgi:hypothetical protein